MLVAPADLAEEAEEAEADGPGVALPPPSIKLCSHPLCLRPLRADDVIVVTSRPRDVTPRRDVTSPRLGGGGARDPRAALPIGRGGRGAPAGSAGAASGAAAVGREARRGEDGGELRSQVTGGGGVFWGATAPPFVSRVWGEGWEANGTGGRGSAV